MGLTASAERVAEAARRLGLDIAIIEHERPTRTAEEAAAACGCAVGEIVKSLVFQRAGDGRPVLLLVSGANRVDEAAVAVHIGDRLRRPDAAFVRAVTGYAIGGIPPFGHDQPLDTYVDRDLATYDRVWAAAGTPNAVFQITAARLVEVTRASVIPVT